MKRYLKKAGACLPLFLALYLSLCSGGAFRVYAGMWSYGAQLAGAAKDVYDALSGSRGLRDPEMFGEGLCGEEGIRIPVSGKYGLQDSARLACECQMGAEAFLRDHSEIFWISGFALALGFQSAEGGAGAGETAAAYVTLCPADYYEGIRGEVKRTQRIIDRMIRTVRKCGSRYEKVKAAHDLVLETMDYVKKGEDRLWHHTVTGGLLDRYGHRGVCEAYAKLFDILCRANDIPAVLVTGGLRSENVSHMWNYVQMENGSWYLVDVTNDDQKEARHDYFLAGSQTDAFLGRVGTTHRASGYLRAGQREPFRLPALARTAYGGNVTRKLTVSKARITLAKGKKYRISVKRKPLGANDPLTYTSSDAKTVFVNAKGRIKARKKGKAVVTVRAAGGKKARIRVTVR